MFKANIEMWDNPAFRVQLRTPTYEEARMGGTGLVQLVHTHTPALHEALQSLNMSDMEIDAALFELLGEVGAMGISQILERDITPDNMTGVLMQFEYDVTLNGHDLTIAAVTGLQYRLDDPKGMTSFTAFMLPRQAVAYTQERRTHNTVLQ